ncbi:MAG: hypothetical protein KTR18_01145 [Acidiferrobacterales bacterium]|nr:hypothetical protein [Acidiferrobacterales bacterium]
MSLLVNRAREKIGKALASYLTRNIKNYTSFSSHESPGLHRHLQPGDILLVEGDTRISNVIKYLTQSTWSHAAFFAGGATEQYTESGERCTLVEAELGKGVIASPLSRYHHINTRICRPIGLSPEDRKILVSKMVAAIGKDYDLKHIIDLMRYLLPTPPIPARFRRRMIALGSGDPSRAICSTLIAETFQSIHYPILPTIKPKDASGSGHPYHSKQWFIEQEILHIRHHSLFTPRDFDVSPFFQVVKPTIETGFNYRKLQLTATPPQEE